MNGSYKTCHNIICHIVCTSQIHTKPLRTVFNCVCMCQPPSLSPSLSPSLPHSLPPHPPSLLTLPPSDGLCHEVPESLCSASEEHLQGGQTGQRTDQEDGPRERRVTMVSTLSLTHTHTHLSISELLLANRVSKLVVGTESIFYGCCLNGFFLYSGAIVMFYLILSTKFSKCTYTYSRYSPVALLETMLW